MSTPNEHTEGTTHVTEESVILENPNKVAQENAEHKKTTNAVTDTSTDHHDSKKGKGVSHATGDSKVPEKIQEMVPESVEKALSNSVHDTGKQ